MIYFEKSMGNSSQARAVQAILLPTALLFHSSVRSTQRYISVNSKPYPPGDPGALGEIMPYRQY